jgi:RNA polymerase sigma factor (sigma-70 family)
MDIDTKRRERFDRVFAAHYAQVLAYALRRAPRALAEDAVSETFIVAWRRLDALPEDALPWLLGVTRRTLSNQRRADRRADALAERLALHATTASNDVPEASFDVEGPVGRALARLSENEREALLLIAWEGLSPQQAAAAAGCSRTAFRLRLHRARKHFAALVAQTPQTTVEQPAALPSPRSLL